MKEPPSIRGARTTPSPPIAWGSYVLPLGLLAAIASIQLRIGGARPIFAYPGYLILAGAGLASLAFRRGPGQVDGPCLASTLAFAGYLLLRTLASPVEYLARTDLFLILASLIVYLLVAVFCSSPRQRLLCLAGLLVLALGHVGVGLVQFVRGQNFLPFGYERADYGARASGFYVCPDHFAGLLECLALLALSAALFGRVKLWARVLLFYSAGVAAAGIILSGSRGGYLSAAVGGLFLGGFAVWHILSRDPRRRWAAAAAAGLVLFAAAIAAVCLINQSALLSQRFNGIADSKDVRLPLWRAALREFQLQPWTGTGAGTYLIYGRKFRDPSIQMDPVYAHGDYLQLLAEFGLVGGVLFAWFFFAHFRAAIAFVRKREASLQARGRVFSLSLSLVAGAALALTALAVHSVFDFNVQIPGNTLVAAFAFAVLANPGVVPDRFTAPRDRNGVFAAARFLPPIAGLPFIALLPIRLLPAEAEAEQARQALRKEAYALAILHARNGLNADPANPDLWYYLGESRRQLGSRFRGQQSAALLATATQAFEAGLKLFPMDDRLLVKAALAYAQQGDFRRADQLFKTAFEWSPDLGQIYGYYGLRFQLQRRWPEALAAYRRSNELHDNAIAAAGLNETLDQTTQHPPLPEPSP